MAQDIPRDARVFIGEQLDFQLRAQSHQGTSGFGAGYSRIRNEPATSRLGMFGWMDGNEYTAGVIYTLEVLPAAVGLTPGYPKSFSLYYNGHIPFWIQC